MVVNNSELVEQVTKLVIEQLNKNKDKAPNRQSSSLILGTRDCIYTEKYIASFSGSESDNYIFFDESFENYEEIKNYEKIIMPYMGVNTMAHLANGISHNSFEKTALNCAMQNKAVHVLNYEYIVKDLKQTCNANYYKMLCSYAKKLESFGFIPFSGIKNDVPAPHSACDLSSKKVITENDIKNVSDESEIYISKSKKYIFTPSAKDLINKKSIKITVH